MRLLFSIILLPFLAVAQTPEIDSLKQIVARNPDDTAKVNTLNQLNKLLWQLGDFNKCLENGLTTLELAQKLNYEAGIAAACGNIGIAYRHMGNYSKSLEYYFRALRIDEARKDMSGLSKRLNNIGLVFLELGNPDKALEYYFRALAIDEALQNEKGKATRLANIGSVYDSKEDHARALQYYTRALEIDQKLGNSSGIARDYGNIGNLHAVVADSAAAKRNKALARARYDLAAAYFARALAMYEESGDQDGVATYMGNLGLYHLTTGNYKKAEELITKALGIARAISALSLVKDHEQFLSELYEKSGKHKLALQHYQRYIQVRDSIFNEEHTKQQVRAEMNYEFDKKEAAARLEQEKKDAVADAEAKRQRIILLSISGFGLLVLVFAVFAYRSLLQKKKANAEIVRQKHLIEEKQKEILDSIHYARRIQQSLMPNERMLHRTLSQLQAGK